MEEPHAQSDELYLDQARQALSQNPSIRLMRHPQVLFILTFLNAAFKATNQSVQEADLVAGKLSQFLESNPLAEDELPATRSAGMHRAAGLLDHWCREENRFLRRFADDDGRILVELTPHTERVFQWVEALGDAELVGTESRFTEILRRLDDLLDHSDPDPRMAVTRLEEKRRALDEEIRRIKEGGEVKVYSDLQIEERFKALNRLSRELLGDFKQVEQNFKTIVREIYSRQSQGESSRGDILGYTMDATEQLRQSPQGQSFYSFWEFLIRDSGREGLMPRIEDLWSRLEERRIPHKDEVLRHLKTYLHQAGKKVIASNHLLAEKLNKILTEREKRRREKTAVLIREIKDLALKALSRLPSDGVLIRIEASPEVSMIMERPLSDPPRATAFAHKPSREEAPIPADGLKELAEQFYVDHLLLQEQVQRVLRGRESAELIEILERFPPEKGLSEVMAYFALVSQAFQSEIDPAFPSEIPLQREKVLLAPRVVFKHE